MLEFIELVKPYLKDPIVKIGEFGDYFTLRDDEIIASGGRYNDYETFRVAFDNKKCFNKVSQCPIHVNSGLPLSKRKSERLKQAIAYLRTKEGERASATFSWYGWDEFSNK